MHAHSLFSENSFRGLVAIQRLVTNPQKTYYQEVPPKYVEFGGANRAFIDYTDQFISDRLINLPGSLGQRIAELKNLNPNWDGEGAVSIKPQNLVDIVEALNYLSKSMDYFMEPFLAPTFDGSIQMEWLLGSRSLEIEATAGAWSIVGVDSEGDSPRKYHEAECRRTDFQMLERFYQWLVDGNSAWPSK